MEAIRWEGGGLHLLDQRALPAERRWLRVESAEQAADAIRLMVVRGAPAIAITAAYGLALAVRRGDDRAAARALLLAARPTAVNLRWALERLDGVRDVEAAAVALHAEDLAINRALGAHGVGVLPQVPGTLGVLTICNTGALATGGHGTALGVVRSAIEAGRDVRLYALETRPYLQGARLTATECVEDGIPCTLLTDGMAGALLATGRVHVALAGCDRVAANGDAANKIGTYGLAVLCHHHGVPFHIAMPTSTLDPRCPTGADIPIEERPGEEVRACAGNVTAPVQVDVWNPAFDVTPAALITSWITERGIWHPPNRETRDTAPGLG